MFTRSSPNRHRFGDVTTDALASLRGMAQLSKQKSHRHTEVTKHVLRQRAGVPYEVERKMCSSCREVLDERLLRRTAA
jgi:hypothetical protein